MFFQGWTATFSHDSILPLSLGFFLGLHFFQFLSSIPLFPPGLPSPQVSTLACFSGYGSPSQSLCVWPLLGVKGCHEAVSLATWAPSGQPWRNHISIFPHPAGEGFGVGEAFRKQQSYRYLQGPAQRCQESHCPTCWVLRIFPGTSPPGGHLCNLPSHPKAPSRRQVSHKQASSSPAFSLFSPEKVTLCPEWHLSFDGKTQSPLLRVTAINHRVCCSFLSKVFCVFYICLVVSITF